jgi:hypothetical protein
VVTGLPLSGLNSESPFSTHPTTTHARRRKKMADEAFVPSLSSLEKLRVVDLKQRLGELGQPTQGKIFIKRTIEDYFHNIYLQLLSYQHFSLRWLMAGCGCSACFIHVNVVHHVHA